MILRILASVTLLFFILFMPFWVSVVLALAGMAYFSFFIEAVFLFLLVDLLYGAREPKLFNMVFVSFILAVISLAVVELSKRKLRFNKK
ncbi:MAG: hypothetical protein WC735_01555 [Candidatus Paceibacterota bacterium]|jgi:hypothetical protein